MRTTGIGGSFCLVAEISRRDPIYTKLTGNRQRGSTDHSREKRDGWRGIASTECVGRFVLRTRHSVPSAQRGRQNWGALTPAAGFCTRPACLSFGWRRRELRRERGLPGDRPDLGRHRPPSLGRGPACARSSVSGLPWLPHRYRTPLMS